MDNLHNTFWWPLFSYLIYMIPLGQLIHLSVPHLLVKLKILFYKDFILFYNIPVIVWGPNYISLVSFNTQE